MTHIVDEDGVWVVIRHERIQPIQIVCHGCRAVRSTTNYLQKHLSSVNLPTTMLSNFDKLCNFPTSIIIINVRLCVSARVLGETPL